MDETKASLTRLSAKLRAMAVKDEEAMAAACTASSVVSVPVSVSSSSVAGAGDETFSESGGGVSRSGKPRVRPVKKWGKKGKKHRDKNPYNDDDGDEERPVAGARVMGRKGVGGGMVGGDGFTRVTMPHYAGRQQL